jgi:hypothetical protein
VNEYVEQQLPNTNEPVQEPRQNTTNINANIRRLLRDLIHNYNSNISLYQENMRELIRLFDRVSQLDENTNPATRTRRFSRQSNASNIHHEPLSRYAQGLRHRMQSRYTQPPINTNASNALNSLFTNYINQVRFEDVVVSLTPAQIIQYTRIVPYDSAIHNSPLCPICLDEFADGQQVCQIIHCGHIFKRSELLLWFQRNVHCPVCRHDLRDSSNNDMNDDDQPITNDDHNLSNQQNLPNPNVLIQGFPESMVDNLLNELQTPILYGLTNIFNNLQTNDNGGLTRQTFTFDIPLYFDASYNDVD